MIEATLKLIETVRVEDFSVSDAARAVGVSSGAPYRHFSDRDDLLGHVAAAGFVKLAQSLEIALESERDEVKALVAIGIAYVDFVSKRPELFHLMWGAARGAKNEIASEKGAACYQVFLSSVVKLLNAKGVQMSLAKDFGDPLWAMVHGFAGLTLSGAERMDNEDARIDAMIDTATRAYVTGALAQVRDEHCACEAADD